MCRDILPQLDCIIIVKATSKGIILAEIIENGKFNTKIFLEWLM